MGFESQQVLYGPENHIMKRLHAPRSSRPSRAFSGFIGLFVGLSGSMAVAAAPEKEKTVWTLNGTEKVGNAVPEVMGAPKPLPGAVQAISFDGARDGLLVPANPLAGCDKFTVEILFYPASGGGEEQRFFHAEDTAASRALMELRVLPGGQWCLDSYLRVGKTGLALLDRAKGHPLDRWHWVAMIYDGKTLTGFVNGAKEMEGDIAFPSMKDGRISLGVRQNKVSWFKGAIREVRFHPTALTADQLQTALPKP